MLGDLWRDSDRLFINDDGKQIYPNLILIWLNKVLEKTGLKKVTLHSLRHTNISLQLSNGVDVRTVAGRAGHSNAAVTLSRYSHFMKEPDKKASDKINEIFGGLDKDDFSFENQNELVDSDFL